MNCKKIILILTLFFITNCTTTIQKNNKNIISIEVQYSNKGLTMINFKIFFIKKIISKKINKKNKFKFNNNLKKKSIVK